MMLGDSSATARRAFRARIIFQKLFWIRFWSHSLFSRRSALPGSARAQENLGLRSQRESSVSYRLVTIPRDVQMNTQDDIAGFSTRKILPVSRCQITNQSERDTKIARLTKPWPMVPAKMALSGVVAAATYKGGWALEADGTEFEIAYPPEFAL